MIEEQALPEPSEGKEPEAILRFCEKWSLSEEAKRDLTRLVAGLYRRLANAHDEHSRRCHGIGAERK